MYILPEKYKNFQKFVGHISGGTCHWIPERKQGVISKGIIGLNPGWISEKKT